MKRCEVCKRKFIPSRSNQIYCNTSCRERSTPRPSCDVIERLEREIVDSMSLVQLERKKISELKVYRIQYNRVRDYLINSVEPTIDDIKMICNV